MALIIYTVFSKVLLENRGPTNAARVPEESTRRGRRQKRHHVPRGRHGCVNCYRGSHPEGSASKQNRGGNCVIVGEIPQCRAL